MNAKTFLRSVRFEDNFHDKANFICQITGYFKR